MQRALIELSIIAREDRDLFRFLVELVQEGRFIEFVALCSIKGSWARKEAMWRMKEVENGNEANNQRAVAVRERR